MSSSSSSTRSTRSSPLSNRMNSFMKNNSGRIQNRNPSENRIEENEITMDNDQHTKLSRRPVPDIVSAIDNIDAGVVQETYQSFIKQMMNDDEMDEQQKKEYQKLLFDLIHSTRFSRLQSPSLNDKDNEESGKGGKYFQNLLASLQRMACVFTNTSICCCCPKEPDTCDWNTGFC